jgi:hypothetical protein
MVELESQRWLCLAVGSEFLQWVAGVVNLKDPGMRNGEMMELK